MSVISIGDRDFVLLFRLIGIGGIETDDRDVERIVRKLVESDKYDAIVVSERHAITAKRVREEVLRSGKVRPLFVIVPGPEGPIKKRIEEIHSLITQAIGVRLKLE